MASIWRATFRRRKTRTRERDKCETTFDAATGLYYLRARYMNPGTGTFTSMDAYQGSTSDPMSLHKYPQVRCAAD